VGQEEHSKCIAEKQDAIPYSFVVRDRHMMIVVACECLWAKILQVVHGKPDGFLCVDLRGGMFPNHQNHYLAFFEICVPLASVSKSLLVKQAVVVLQQTWAFSLQHASLLPNRSAVE
jgi:hypothetical protein